LAISIETVSKLFQNYFGSVSFRCADGLTYHDITPTTRLPCRLRLRTYSAIIFHINAPVKRLDTSPVNIAVTLREHTLWDTALTATTSELWPYSSTYDVVHASCYTIANLETNIRPSHQRLKAYPR